MNNGSLQLLNRILREETKVKKKSLYTMLFIAIGIILFGGNNAFAETLGIYEYSIKNDEAIITWCVPSSSDTLAVPAYIGDYPVKVIGEQAFSGCSNVKNVTLPEGITVIEDYAFYNCSELESVVIPNSLTSIGKYSFHYCGNLKSLILPDSVVSIGESAFEACKSMTSIRLSKGLTKISAGAFISCGLESVTIPDGVTVIEKNAFAECSNMKSIVIPDTVTSIGTGAFANCGFESVTLPNGLSEISEYMFHRCRNLKSITIPASIKTVVKSAFSECTGLTDVYYVGNAESWNKIDIENNNSNNSALVNAEIHYIFCRTETVLSNNNKTFTVTPINIENGQTVILALYFNDKLLSMQSAVYDGKAITFVTDVNYTNAKVLVWYSLTSLIPACEAELVK